MNEPVPGEGPIEGVITWRGEVYVARQGCVWRHSGDTWVLAIGEALPPSFPPSKPQGHEP